MGGISRNQKQGYGEYTFFEGGKYCGYYKQGKREKEASLQESDLTYDKGKYSDGNMILRY